MPKKIPIVFHNGSNYDCYFIVKELTEKLRKQFHFLGENTKKYITFTVRTEKEITRIDKNEEGITKDISYILQFVYSARFMARSLSNPVNNLSEVIDKIKFKDIYNRKKYETCGIKFKCCDCFLEYANFKDDLVEYKCLCCNKYMDVCMDDWKKEDSYSHLNMEDITDADFPHAKRVSKDFEVKHLKIS